MQRITVGGVVLLAGLSVVGAGLTGDATHDAGAAGSASTNASAVVPVAAAGHGRYRVVATVLQNPTHGPQLCHGVTTSYPPQCGGPDIVGWSWQRVPYESANGTSWGTYLLVGTFDGSRFTLTEPATSSVDAVPRRPNPDYRSPCAPPPGGWAPVDPGRATHAGFDQALALAARLPGYAGAWIDQNGGVMNDPARLVLNVRYTGDPTVHQAKLRAVWGGALCLSRASRTEAELQAIVAELAPRPGVILGEINVVTNNVRLTTYVVDAAWQRELDDRYGAGVVLVEGFLQPIG